MCVCICVYGCYTAAVRRKCRGSVDTGHGGMAERQLERAVNGVRVSDSRGDSANDVGDAKLLFGMLA